VPYALLAEPRAQRELDALPPRIQQGLRLVLQTLAQNPRDGRFDLKPMRGVRRRPPYLRLRVGDYRVLLQVDHKARQILVAMVGHRKDVYRGVDELDE
jgi:mRNA interferase RelE/StbE